MDRKRRIAILTSGGDAPGMNAAIRAAVRTGLEKGWQMMGILHGYEGLIEGQLVPLGARDVGGIISSGGTILHSARSSRFKTNEGREHALSTLKRNGVEGLIVVGGGGSQKGANELSKRGYPVVGVASTIDNDLFGSDITIGVHTAVNTAIEAIDRLRTTASSHDRVFVVEVMGRDCGYLALISGITGGAESIVIPEKPAAPAEVVEEVLSACRRGKSHAIVVVSEGAACNAEQLALYFSNHMESIGFELRVTRLGHVQRGGVPDAYDRLLATRLAARAVESIARGEYGVLIGLLDGREAATPLPVVASSEKTLDLSLLKLAKILAQ